MTSEHAEIRGGQRQMLKVLIADEDLDSRVATRKALQRGQLDIAGETGYGNQAVSLALQTHPDAILIAVEEPAGRALETAEGMASVLPDTPILIYSSIDDAASIRRAMLFGASDYLVKPLMGAPLRGAIARSLEREELRQMRRSGQLSYRGQGTVISVTGAKGGVGKSVVAVNLALALRLQTGKSVAILDADTQFGDVATMLDLKPTSTAFDLLQSLDKVDRNNYRDFITTHETGLNVVAAHDNEDTWRDVSREQVQKVIARLAEVHEFLVIDTAGSFDSFVQACVEASTLTFVVTSGEVSSVRDTGSAMRRLDNWGIDHDKVRLVLNRGRKAPGVHAEDVARSVGREIFWDIPFDGAVPDSVQLGRPVVSTVAGSPFAKSIVSLALRVAGTSRALVDEPRARASFWKRIPRFKGQQA
jgi:pilus assembly protein CpaE